MNRLDLPTLAGSPAEVRAVLAQRGRWSGELDALDLALEAMSDRSLAPVLAVVWTGDPPGPGLMPHVLVVGDTAMVMSTMTASGVATSWYLSDGQRPHAHP